MGRHDQEKATESRQGQNIKGKKWINGRSRRGTFKLKKGRDCIEYAQGCKVC